MGSYSGALLAAKGLNDLCELIEAAAQDQLVCHFLIVGYPLHTLERFLDEKNLRSWCTLTGRIPYEELSGYLALANIAIEPKMSDSGEASGKLLNYMAAALPVVCYDSPNNSEILASAGFLADRSAGVSSLLSRLKQALSSPEEAQRRGKIARTRVEKTYSWDAAAAKVYAVYQDNIISN